MIPVQTLLSGLRFPGLRMSASIGPMLENVRAKTRRLAPLDDEQLLAESLRLRDRTIASGGAVVDTAAAFALADEVAYRSMGIRFYDVQLMASWSLLRNEVAEMKTGEGKTLVGALVSYARGLQGRGAHFMTTNEYLAGRDYDFVRPMMERLGMTVGLLRQTAAPPEKREAYHCDVTYGPGYEFGFDYLRDQLDLIREQQPRLGEVFQSARRGETEREPLGIQREHFCAIVDEADSVMIDEATTPLVLAGNQSRAAEHPQPYLLARRVASQLTQGRHFTLDGRQRMATMTRTGQQEIAGLLDLESRRCLRRPWTTYVQQALQARHFFAADEHYVVSDDRVKIVDSNTGRVFEDRTWSDGLHQAVEAKEGVTIHDENQSLARISRQQFFRLYENLCGMTGTAIDSEAELRSVYQLAVTLIPTHRPCRRTVEKLRCFATVEAKWQAIADSVRRIHAGGRPVLIGTRTIEDSEEIAERLADLPFQLLNGKQDAEEARIIAGAGRRGAIMIATNMAGRGTDIKLDPGVAELGGLHVIVSEPHESARVDRQFEGRASRQGDPGSCQTFVSADDELIAQHAPWMARFIRRMAGSDQEVDADLRREIAKLQKAVERKSAGKRSEMFSHERRLEETLETLAKQ